MENNCYSPHTGEHINTDSPSDWMGRAGTPAPSYDRLTKGCFFKDGAWVIVDSPKKDNPRIDEIKAELASIDLKRIRPLAEGDAEYLATLNAKAISLRDELIAISQ